MLKRLIMIESLGVLLTNRYLDCYNLVGLDARLNRLTVSKLAQRRLTNFAKKTLTLIENE